MTAPIFYSSADASAPTLTGQTGALNTVLDAILVNGYGAKSAAGWTKPYTDAGTQTAVFRPAAGNRHYLQIQDNGPGAATFQEARARGYVSMSAYNTGTEPFPTAAQQANGLSWRKSAAANGTARSWWALADDKTIHFFVDPGDGNTGATLYTFGAFNSWKSGDLYSSIITGRIGENTAAISSAIQGNMYSAILGTPLTSGYAPRSYTGVSGAVALNNYINGALSGVGAANYFGAQGPTYPSPVDGGLVISPLYLTESNIARGTMRGLWIPCQSKPILQDDTYTATDGATSRTMRAVNTLNAGQVHVETSNTIDTP